MTRHGTTLLAAMALTAALSASTGARAAEPANTETPDVVEARAEFVRGNELAKTTQWAQALAAFERSFELRPHPLTTYNMAVCERALGQLAKARPLFAAAIASGEKDASQFPPSRLEEARAYLGEIEAALVRVEVAIDPPDALLGVDGRPLVATAGEAGVEAVAGLAKPGQPEKAPAPKFVLVTDPGTHVFRVVAKGYQDVLVTKSFAPGQRTTLDLALARLPATVRITSDVASPIVTVDGADVGLAPVQVSRPAGTYRIVVRKEGFETFDTRVAMNPGQEVDLPTKLPPERIPITKRWWFWGAALGAVAGGVALTYAVTRPDPAPPPYSGGTTGWVVAPR
ncbi:MAG: PEGA domain-containing protein [Labilithrix sp.]|nr:PEGA domain-containing protein [Labilithrix sp.]